MGMEQGAYIDGDGSDFTYGYGGGGDEVSIDIGGGSFDFGDSDFYYGYGAGESSSGDNLYGDYLNYWLEQGLDFETASQWATEDAAAGSIETITSEQGNLPDISSQPFYGLPYIPDPFLTPYTPIFPDLPPPAPPSPPLPGYCPAGTYHPIDDPYSCVPFPQATTQQQQKPPAQQAPAPSKPPAQQQKPQQQACPTGYCKHPQTGQCIRIPQGYTRHPQTQICTPIQQQQQACPTGYCRHPVTGQCMPIPNGYYRHPQTQVCTPQTAQASPLPIPDEAGDLFSNLKNLPWWIWLALGGLILLSRDGDGGKKTTVTYRRAR